MKTIQLFFTYEVEPCFYTVNDLSKALLKILQPDYDGYHNTIDVEFDDDIREVKIVVIPVLLLLGLMKDRF